MQSIIILYDKEDVIEFNNQNENIKDIFLFSPGLELYLKIKIIIISLKQIKFLIY